MEDKTTLDEQTIQAALRKLNGWEQEGISLKKIFYFDNYRDITSFLNHLVNTITEQNHHPDFALQNSSRSVSVDISTHSAKAITKADILFAQTLENWKS